MKEVLIFETIGKVGKITLNRPDKFNSFNREMTMKFLDAIKECGSSDTIAAIYITGNGKAFCAGQDLKEAIDPNNGLSLSRIVREHYNQMALAVYHCPKPIVAAVNGVAAGAGANLALLCDIVLASESATFIQAFSKIGLIPDTAGTYALPRLVGFQKALALAMLGDKVSAQEAERIGMIYKFFPDDEFESASFAIAEKLSKMPTKGLALTKKAFNKGLCDSFEDHLEVEAQLQTEAGESYDYNEGVQAFLEKRKPKFKGK